MQLVIIPKDNLVIIDGRGLRVDLSYYTSVKGIHAIQWDGEKGQIEYDNSKTEEFRPNRRLEALDQFREIIEAWQRTAVAEDIKLRQQEKLNAEHHTEDGSNHGRRSPQPSVRKKDGYTTVRGEGVQSGRR